MFESYSAADQKFECIAGRQVNWIGATLSISQTAIHATILESRLDDIRTLIAQVSAKNVVPLKTLATLAGKAQSMASLL